MAAAGGTRLTAAKNHFTVDFSTRSWTMPAQQPTTAQYPTTNFTSLPEANSSSFACLTQANSTHSRTRMLARAQWMPNFACLTQANSTRSRTRMLARAQWMRWGRRGRQRRTSATAAAAAAAAAVAAAASSPRGASSASARASSRSHPSTWTCRAPSLAVATPFRCHSAQPSPEAHMPPPRAPSRRYLRSPTVRRRRGRKASLAARRDPSSS